ncbi:MAG TPA: BatA domain-containing protein [Thermodesulfobacteriota bacterium]|nr:BatA domain-containing protein [Thermodesulfobacteriota bacterium]
MNFSFLSPYFLIGLAALALPVIAHLISRKSGAVKKFPAITFLLASRGDSAVRSRLKDFLLLLLRALVIALLVLVFARPALFSFAPAGVEGPRSIAVVVDNSFSMGYGGRFDKAVKTARDTISSLPDGSFAIVAPLVAKPGERLSPSSDMAGLRQAAGDIKLTATYADNEKRLSEVYAALSDSPPEKKEVIFLTDMQKNGWRESPAPRDWLRVVDITGGESSPNRAVTSASAGRGKDVTAFEIAVSNFSPEEVSDLLASVGLDGREVNAHLDVGPGERAVREFTLPPDGDAAAPGLGTASIEKDSLPIDDTRYFVLAGGEGSGILIVDGDPREEARLSEAYYLARAGETISEISGAQVSVKDNEAFLSEDLSPYGVVFLANAGDILPSNAEALREFVTNGGTLVIFPGERIRPSSYNALLKGLLPGQLLTIQEAGTFVSPGGGGAFSGDVRERLGSVRVGRHFSIYPEEGSETILSTASGDPFLLRKGLGGGSVYLFASTADTGWNDLPISPVFLPVVKELMDTSDNSGVRKRSYLAGEIAAIDVPPGAEGAEVSAPGGVKTPLSGAEPVFSATDTPGIYTVTQGGKPHYSFSVNIDPAESDLSRITIESPAPAEAGRPGFVKVFSELWRYFLWGAIALFISEAAVRALFS